jgi:23S rRNA (adenine2503-C2)-methyltransferase
MNWTHVDNIASSDENVHKYVFKNKTAVAEAVLYKYPTYKDRTVICCSTQSGCPVGCRFCGAGDYFNRSLTSDEIVEQVTYLLEDVFMGEGTKPGQIKKLQIMFMSMGEPLYNIDELLTALGVLSRLYPNAKLLISTSAPKNRTAYIKIIAASRILDQIGLQFSVHESTDEARKKLIPSATCTLEEISQYGEQWATATGRRPFFNYCVHSGNNSDSDIERLVKLFKPEIWEATLSVICERDEHIAAANKRQRELVQDFMSKMLTVGYSVRMFNPAGQDDIGGGCGQLWFVQDWMRTHPEYCKPSAGNGLDKVHTPQ